jgi:uncharacterized protein (TIGR02996 family)
MSDEAGFIEAIRQAPDETAHRLVYADWLEERGDPRAEYLRLQCQAAQLAPRLAAMGEQLDPEWLASVRHRPQPVYLELHGGRRIRLRALRQFGAYEGLLEGLPTRRLNQDIIDHILGEERGRQGAGEPYLIRPAETPIEYHRDRPYPFGEPAAMPGIVCVGRFDSSPVEAHADFSELAVIWFQDEFAFPIDPRVMAQLRAIDWDGHAVDGLW